MGKDRDHLLRQIRVVVVSPNDVGKERRSAKVVIDELNRLVADNRLVLWSWETDARPGLNMEGPQGVIDTLMDIQNADVVIGVFWKRFGTPTGKAGSGTAHELRHAWESWDRTGRPEVMVYFSTRKHSPQVAEELSQWKEVLEFKRELPDEQLWWEYEKVKHFEALLREHLTRYVLDRQKQEHADLARTERAALEYKGEEVEPVWAGRERAGVEQQIAQPERVERSRAANVPGQAGDAGRGRSLVAVAAVLLAAVVAALGTILMTHDNDDASGTSRTSTLPSAASGKLALKRGPTGCFSVHHMGGCATALGLGRAHSVAVSRDGKNAYVASFAGAVAVFQRDRDTGELTVHRGPAGCLSDDGSGGACARVPALEGAESVAVSRDGKNVYVASYKANALVVLERAQGGGLLRTLAGTGSCVSYGGAHGCAAGTALKGANSVAISRNGRSVYVASYRSDAVAIFDRNAGSGALTQKAGRSGCVSEEGTGGACTRAKALDAPESIIVSPDGRNVYVLSDKSNAVTVFDRRADGGLELKHGLRGCISEDGTHDGDGTARCADGAGLNIRDGANAIALSPDGTNVYVAANDSGAVAILDRDATGALSQDRVSGCWSDKRRDRCRVSSSLAGAATVSVSPDGRHVYVGSFEADAIVIFERDAHSGALTRKPGRAGCWAMGPGREGCAMAKALNGVYSVTVSPDGKNLYVAAYMADALSIFDRR